ncbi:HNH endonuclease [Rhodococcus qingshengii]
MWAGFVDPAGYGRVWHADFGSNLAHRCTYEALVGPIPEDSELDHLCRIRSCCNPAHMDPVSHLENMGRGWRAQLTHCKRGHPLSGDNLRVSPAKNGLTKRVCRTCEREYMAEYNARRPPRIRRKN